jgi:hypothetical protein
MAQNDHSPSPLMRKIQEAMERDLHEAKPQQLQTAPFANPMRQLPVVTVPAPRIPPAPMPLPTFNSASISQGDYSDPKTDSLLPEPAFAEEDLSPEELDANSRSRRGGLILASAVIVAGAAAVAAFIFILSPQQEAAGPVPEIRAEPRQAKVAPDITTPPLRTIEPVASAQTPATPVPDAPVSTAPVSMGEVSTELVAPTTEGLSPARRIGTTRILLDGDREIKPQ